MATSVPVATIRRERRFTHPNVVRRYSWVMGTLRLYALGINEMRDLFQGSPQVAERLSQLVAETYPTRPEPPPRGFFDRLMRRDEQPATVATRTQGGPTSDDVDRVVRGHFVSPDRLPAAWNLVTIWLGDRAWGTTRIEIDESAGNDLDFDLAAAGVPPSASVRSLFERSLQLPIQPLPGGAAGYLRGQRADAMRAAWVSAVPRLSPENAETAQQMVTWLGGLDSWRDQARDAGRPAPDIIALYSR